MNHHEALGLFTDLKETFDGAHYRRQALLNNLARNADRAAQNRSVPFDFSEAKALLEGAEDCQREINELEPRVRAAAEGCGKRF